MIEIKPVEFEEINSIIDGILGADQEEKVGPFVEEKRKISFALIDDGQIVGGITAKMNFNRCHVSGLGIEKEFRRGGSGVLLMEKVEEAAIKIGAKIITVSTQDFQAREFYERLGYDVFGELEDCPFKGTTKYYMSKKVGF
jgi:ribosomal protein S18 acetylase RimI-like enzyme